MKHIFFLLLAILTLTTQAQALAVPEELERALPEAAEDILELETLTDANALSGGLMQIWESLCENAEELWRKQTAGAARILLAAVLCGAVEAVQPEKHSKTTLFLPMAGALAITGLTVGSLDSLMGLGRETIRQLADFSEILLPLLAVATAAAGGVQSATLQQLAAVFFVELLIQMIEQLLMPVLLLYVGLLTAACCLEESRLQLLAEGLRKLIAWALCAVMFLFTGYLSAARIFTGPADAAAIRLTKATLSGAVPVVGGILSEAAEAVLAGAGVLRGSVGLIGLLSVLAVCGYPFLRLGIQYLLYKLTACLSSLLETPELSWLIDGLGSAFGLILGMTGSCALLLLLSVISCISAVVSS